MNGYTKYVRLGLAGSSLLAGAGILVNATDSLLGQTLALFGVMMALGERHLARVERIDSVASAGTVGRNGQAAELDALQALKARLPAGAVLFHDLLIPNPRSAVGSTEADVVAVTSAGIFLVEVKSHRGDVLAEEVSENWRIVSRKKPSLMRNPVRQVKSQIRAIRAYLQRNGVDAPVYGAVYMPNADVKRKGHLSAPVFTHRKFLAPFALAKESCISDETVAQIVALLRAGGDAVPNR